MHYHNRIITTVDELFDLPNLSVVGIAAPNQDNHSSGLGVSIPGVTKDKVFMVMQKDGDHYFTPGDGAPVTREHFENGKTVGKVFPIYVLYHSEEDSIA